MILRRACAVFISLWLGVCSVGVADKGPEHGPANDDATVLRLLHRLNSIPEMQLNEKTNPTLNVLKWLYDADGPEYLRLRRLMGRAEVRRTMNAGNKALIGNILAQRWDTFFVCGNLFLAGLRSHNASLQAMSRRKLVDFIQPVFVPEIVHLLEDPNAKGAAYEILKELSGKTYKPESRIWSVWWNLSKGKFDVVGHLLKDTRDGLVQRPIRAFDQARYWYAPDAIKDVNDEKRSGEEQSALDGWTAWVRVDVRRYALSWGHAKPLLDRIIHQPDPRVNKFLERLLSDPGYGDYASLALAWRASGGSLPMITQSFHQNPTPGRALARGSMGDKKALRDLLDMIREHHQPLAMPLMESSERVYLPRLHSVGVLPAEQAFELLCHHVFNFDEAMNASDKKKAAQKAKHWLDQNESELHFDRRRGYYITTER